MVKELDGSVLKCVHDQNGNHVIQKCIERASSSGLHRVHHFLILWESLGSFNTPLWMPCNPESGKQLLTYTSLESRQRVLEHIDDTETQRIIMEEIMHSVCTRAQDQYGNYVIQVSFCTAVPKLCNISTNIISCN
ncbi:unnamed protein product [Brassica rapa]|uniref:PUM-HD domain-containing protein n=2 Tax=Brassica TaxID=3705 RepID=A0A8D9GEV6_BRACM|nr:unnamed protein product [Brassica napus]CAG7877967.1 unnamed protein product [Brassica rapa]